MRGAWYARRPGDSVTGPMPRNRVPCAHAHRSAPPRFAGRRGEAAGVSCPHVGGAPPRTHMPRASPSPSPSPRHHPRGHGTWLTPAALPSGATQLEHRGGHARRTPHVVVVAPTTPPAADWRQPRGPAPPAGCRFGSGCFSSGSGWGYRSRSHRQKWWREHPSPTGHRTAANGLVR